MTKRAVLVGCNYPGTDDELNGCVNDVTSMKDVLLARFGFEEANIVFMIDTDEGAVQPTGKNIVTHLTAAIQASEEGDVLYFHFSGHGGQIPAETGDEEDDGQDECIYPTDMNPLTDDSFRVILTNLNPGVSFTFISDSCSSGGLLDSQELQVGTGDDGEEGDETEPTEEELAYSDATKADKRVTPEALARRYSEQSGRNVSTGNIRATIYQLFKEDCSPTIKVFIKTAVGRLEEVPEEEWADLYGEVGSAALGALKEIWDDEEIDNDEYFASAREVCGPVDMSGHANRKPEGETLSGSAAVLISGCESDQTTLDVGGENGGYGALSNAIKTILEQYEGRISNVQLANEVRKMMVKTGMDQRPCLYCSEERVDSNFICEFE